MGVLFQKCSRRKECGEKVRHTSVQSPSSLAVVRMRRKEQSTAEHKTRKEKSRLKIVQCSRQNAES